MSRELFEKFAVEKFGAINLSVRSDTGKYQVDRYETAWQGFQSGHAAGLEDITADLDFEPDENHTIADMANVGRSLMADIKIYRPDYCWNERPSEIVGDLSERITELEASLADSNEALQVMGLKLAHAEADRADFMEIAKERSARCVQLAEHRSQLAAQLQSHSANTVGGPTPGAAPACEPTRISSETIAAGHPCFDPDGPPDHDWEYVDDSFSHEFGTEICGHYECARCNAIKPE